MAGCSMGSGDGRSWILVQSKVTGQNVPAAENLFSSPGRNTGHAVSSPPAERLVTSRTLVRSVDIV